MGSRPPKAPESPLDRRPKQIPLDPKRQLVQILESGMESALAWEFVHTCGHFYLLSNAVLAAPFLGRELVEGVKAYQRVQVALERLMAGDPDAPISAICRHSSLAGLINAAQNVICQPGWFLDPSQVVLVAADQAELDALMALLRQPMAGQGSDEDPLAAAQWVAENLMAPYPGWKISGPLPVRLASEIGPEDSWREVFLSPRCLELPALEVLPAVRAARVGLQIPAMGGEDAAAGVERQWHQWDWDAQDRKQARRLAEWMAQSEEQYRASLTAAQMLREGRKARLASRESSWRARVGPEVVDRLERMETERSARKLASPYLPPAELGSAECCGDPNVKSAAGVRLAEAEGSGMAYSR
ncbi:MULTISPECIES: hypothetical protein [unclassified Synechococcus]|uniref:hypothetical protein n=1 Tax=unclassified Synechococcus TaxID=2626047 RepID=UPI001C217953|nr:MULTISPECIES: hypothetical protein [unclassified Synechococcus]